MNVSGHNRLPMAALREVLLGLGYAEPRTYIQSGNAVFRGTIDHPAGAAQALEAAIATATGARSAVVLRSAEAFLRRVHDNPFAAEGRDPAFFQLAACTGDFPADHAARLPATSFHPEDYRVVGADVYLYTPFGTAKSRLIPELFPRRLAVVPTIRNWRTVTAIAAMLEDRG